MSQILKRLSISAILCLVLFQNCNSMTRKQLDNAGKMMKNACVPKNGVTMEQVANIKNGEFVDDKNIKCYIACIYQMAQVMKNGKLNYEAAKKQIEMMFPEDLKGPAKVTLEQCKDVANKIKDGCEAAFIAAKCVYDADPKNFVFP